MHGKQLIALWFTLWSHWRRRDSIVKLFEI